MRGSRFGGRAAHSWSPGSRVGGTTILNARHSGAGFAWLACCRKTGEPGRIWSFVLPTTRCWAGSRSRIGAVGRLAPLLLAIGSASPMRGRDTCAMRSRPPSGMRSKTSRSTGLKPPACRKTRRQGGCCFAAGFAGRAGLKRVSRSVGNGGIMNSTPGWRRGGRTPIQATPPEGARAIGLMPFFESAASHLSTLP